VARELKRAAQKGGTEADFRREAARVLEEAASAVGLTISPRDEYHVARGNVDSLYNRLVLEYKRPGTLRSTNSASPNRRAIDQVKGYIEDVGVRDRREANRLAGVATDGSYLIFVRRVGEGWSEDEAMPVSASSAELLLRLLYSLAVGVALIPENLVEDFGPRQWRAKTAVRAIYRGFSSSKSPLVPKLFEQWRTFFSEATDYRQWADRIESKPEFREFVGSLWTREEIRHLEPARVFFVLHTYYALLIKLVASLAAARFANGKTSPLIDLARSEGDELRERLAELERGGLFRHYGIRNFLEGDFFGWYLAAWNHDIEEAVSSMIARLSQYDPGALELAPENARDLLKKLYHSLLPKEIRHDLGEYYTPDWLAERLIRQTLGEADLGDVTKRVVDPACGSGTFLVILIKFIKERAARNRQPPARTLELILRNVVGFDLNPLAVIAARTNYLIALGDLLKERREREIDIPVYQADSILAPSQGTDLFEGDTYPLKTSVGTFRIPAIFAERERIDALANVLDETVEDGVGEKAFLARIARSAELEPEEQNAAENELRSLYRQIRELHDGGVNGVWARIIKNAFAPVFLEPCHYVVGNPPWVNWENLPDEYRSESKPLWEHYGLFPHGGMDTILGKGKKDISMLMTYVSVDRYLRRGGKLGFVFSQSLFKTSGAGQGFRRFKLPDGVSFGPLTVEDMVELAPFEGASNRTAVAVVAKGRAIKYPITYLRWKKRSSGRGSAIGFDTPLEQVTSQKVTFSHWFAEPVDGLDATSAWLTARRGALRALRKILGRAAYSAHAGSFTGGANGVFWVEITGERPGGVSLVANVTEGARRRIPPTQAGVETELLYPLLRGRDVSRWIAEPSAHILMTQDPVRRRGIDVELMEKKYPRARSYLARFEGILRSRAAYHRYFTEDDPFWSMFNVSSFTFAEWKVVWREQASIFTAAVVGHQDGRPVIPDHKLMLVEVASAAEAHYLCAALNSAPATLAVYAYTIEVSTDTHVLENVAVPRYSHRNPNHRRLSELSQAAHVASSQGDTARIRAIEVEIDQGAAQLWGLTKSELAEIQRSLKEA
jgi:SAM-dependent methyltransferase